MNRMEELLEQVEQEYEDGELNWQQYQDTIQAILDDFNQD